MLMTPLTVKNAASSRRRSPGPDERVLVREQRRDGGDAEPVEQRRRRGRARRARAARRCRRGRRARRRTRRARRSGSPTSAAPARGRARGRRASRRGRSRRPRARPRRRAPTPATGSSPVTATHAPTGASPSERAEPEVAEPRDALQVRVDDEEHDRDRPEPAHERVELEDGDEEDARARPRRAPSTCARESVPAGSSRLAVRGLRASISASISRFRPIASVRAPTIATVTQSQSAADGDSPSASSIPTYANGSAKTVCSSFTSEAKRRGSETAVVAHVCLCAVSASASRPSACPSAGCSTA